MNIDYNNLPEITIDEFLDNCGHILIAGTTGSGKSTLMNNILLALKRRQKCIYLNEPRFLCDKEAYNDERSDLFFDFGEYTDASAEYFKKNHYKYSDILIFIDPKKVEFYPYVGTLLRGPCEEYYSDYFDSDDEGDNSIEFQLFSLCEGMDARFKEMKEKHLKYYENYPVYIFIDEYADLAIRGDKELEKYILRIAQLGRAANYHLILATQSPTSEIVNTRIKANIPDKICLRTSNAQESRNVLDDSGAELLPRNGWSIVKKDGYLYKMKIDNISSDDVIEYYKWFKRDVLREIIKPEFWDEIIDAIEYEEL